MAARTQTEGLDYLKVSGNGNSEKEIVRSYAHLFNLFPEGVLVINEDASKILYANNFILSLTHFTLEEIQGKNFLDLFHIPDIHSFLEYFSFSVKQNESSVFELLMKGRISQFIPVKLTVSSAKIDGQKFIVCSVSDQSDYKRLEVERNMLSHALRQVNEGLSVFDLDGRILFVNEAFLDTFGYEKEEIIGTSIESLFASAGQYDFKLHILPASLKGGWNGEFKVKRKDNKEITIFLSTSPVKDNEDQPVVVVGVISDITLRKQLEEQLRHSQKMEAIGQLAGGIAHDFNNLLTVIEGYLDLLQNLIKKESKLTAYFMQIKKATDRAVSLTRQLLTFSRRQILQPKILDINQNIKDLSAMLERLISENIELITDLDSGIWPIKADPHQVEQVIMNLIVNARDAMPDGGKLIISTKNIHLDSSYNRLHPNVKVGDYILLSISDTGIGMTPEVRERIFEPFFTTKEKGKGTGLGLATVYGIVKQSNGHIYVYSEPGKGTTFKIYFPAVKVNHVSKNNKRKNKTALGNGEGILVVEDEYLVRELILDSLKNLGYHVWEASNAEQALKIFQEHKEKIDLVLSDLIMPGMNGKKLMETIQKEAPDLQFLIMSGYDDNAISKHGLLEEGINYISKPFSPKVLAEKLQEVFRN
ncbi:hybrid sensor histidine kinase/response regulator [candidate division KSB1 bacterium]|nr:MAG: hybrid sensor histidine kinase/response regulator [candidate division KSB1 bacterium]